MVSKYRLEIYKDNGDPIDVNGQFTHDTIESAFNSVGITSNGLTDTYKGVPAWIGNGKIYIVTSNGAGGSGATDFFTKYSIVIFLGIIILLYLFYPQIIKLFKS